MRGALTKRRKAGVPVMFMTDAIGTIRRVQALAAIGYSPRRVGMMAGLGQPMMSQLMAGKHKRVNVRTAQAVADVFERLAMTPAPPSRETTYALKRARENGWPPPLAWDDIDAKGSRPKGVRRAA